jgi:hypothetical protein
MIIFLIWLIVIISIGCISFLLIKKTVAKTKIRPYISIIASFLSAFTTSYVFDFFIQMINGYLTYINIQMPVITWGVASVCLYIVSKVLATRIFQISIGFYFLGSTAVLASFIGHSYNVYVGLLLILIGFSSSFIKID